jgi:hypothetical protein
LAAASKKFMVPFVLLAFFFFFFLKRTSIKIKKEHQAYQLVHLIQGKEEMNPSKLCVDVDQLQISLTYGQLRWIHEEHAELPKYGLEKGENVYDQ